MQTLIRIRSIFEIELPLRTFFESPTIALLAQALISHEAESGSVERMAELLCHIKTVSPESKAEMERMKPEMNSMSHKAT
ncbi:MAG: hypothetical protein LC802_11605 [Acidobacteria bacterium]|nr:hypothetical protein [Acidobacteriota bacterium]